MSHLIGMNAIATTDKSKVKGKIARIYKHRVYIEQDGIQYGMKMSSVNSLKVFYQNGVVEYI